jgi:hypothetical protein
MSTPVWGAGHLGLFLRIGLPSLLAPGNLPGLPHRTSSRYFIYTRPEDMGVLRASPAFRTLSELMPVAVLPIAGHGADPHRLMSDCHMDTMHRADTAGAAAVFLPPDCVWSDGSMVRLQNLADGGKSVVHMSGIRLDRDSVLPELCEHAAGGVLSITGRTLVGMGLRHLHPIALSHFWNEHAGGLMPANLIWSVPGEGLLLRCFHLHPLMVKSQVPFANFSSTIDDDLALHACPDASGDYVVADSDELLAFELSGRDRVVGTVCPKGSIGGVAAWAEIGTNERHRKLIRHAIRLHSVPMTESAWRTLEAESGKIVDVVAYLNALSPRELLGWSSATLKGRIDAAIVARARQHAWHSVGLRFRQALRKINAAVHDRLFLRDGVPRMTHPCWLVRRSVVADVLRYLPAANRTVVVMGTEGPWARQIEAARPGLTVRECPLASAADSATVDALVVIDLGAPTEAQQSILSVRSPGGAPCFWLTSAAAPSLEGRAWTVRQIGGPGTRLANRVWLLARKQTNGLRMLVTKPVWPMRKVLELFVLLMWPLVYVCGAIAGLLLNLVATLLDAVHAARRGDRQLQVAHGVMAPITRHE